MTLRDSIGIATLAIIIAGLPIGMLYDHKSSEEHTSQHSHILEGNKVIIKSEIDECIEEKQKMLEAQYKLIKSHGGSIAIYWNCDHPFSLYF